MADATLADPMIPSNSNDDCLPTPPLDPDFLSDPSFFSDDFLYSDNIISFTDENFDITFDDLEFPSDIDEFVNSTFVGSNPTQFSSDPDTGCVNECVSEPECGSDRVSGDQVVAGYLDITSSDCQEFGVKSLNSSPESGDRNPVSSQGSGNCGSAGSEGLNHPSPDSGNSANNSINEVVDQKVKAKELGNVHVLKRKKESGDSDSRSKTSKFRRSNGAESATLASGLNDDDDDEKKKARLIRNRESAQLSRQRKKHYVEELEDKVRAMHSTIQDLNAKISYIVAENASLRQQMGSNGAGGVCPPPPVMYPPPGMAPMPYPWMPYPPYVMNPPGSKVPLVPIPRLKPQPAAVSKTKKVEVKKGEGKTKKVASVSFLGLLFFILLFGGLVPMINVKYGGMRDAYSGVSGSNYVDSRFYDKHHGRVLTVKAHVNESNHNKESGFSDKFGAEFSCGRGHDERGSHPLPGSDEFKHNTSEPLVASLYVPRNDKLVKIDGNLIIHSVLASEKTMTSNQEMEMAANKETGLAVALNLVPALPVTGLGRNDGKLPRQRESKATDGKLQQWFREGLAGPLLSSGMCTEVFQFDVSAASGAIVPATTSVRNMTGEARQNSTYLNRRILHGLPIPLPSADNITKDHSDKSHKNTSLSSSMVVSVLVDPREAGDGDGDGIMGKKSSFPRIFVVVLLDSVKYVTYSCMLPLMGSSHVVTT